MSPALRPVRAVADQSRLDRAQRAANLSGALGVGGRWAEVVAGSVCVVVDDVVTTGSTLVACAAPLVDAGALGVSAVSVARER